LDNVITFSPPVNHKEGFGSIFQSEIFAFLYALNQGKQFIRSDFNLYNGHNNSVDENKHYSFFEFLNSDNSDIFDKQNVENINFMFAHNFLSKLPFDVRESLISSLRARYWRSKNINSYNLKYYNIAVHIRNLSKGDVVHSIDSIDWQYFNHDYGFKNNNPKFYSKFYSNIINKVIKNLPAHLVPKVTIYSTGDPRDFELIQSLICVDSELKLNGDVLSDFEKFINSDCLIMAHSSLSYLASLIHLGPKYIRKGFRHFLTSDTIEINDFSVEGYTFIDKNIDSVSLFVKRFKFKIFFNNLKNIIVNTCCSIIKNN
jgi:hypothetical protein